MALFQPFDFYSIFGIDVAGTPEIFSLLAILLMSVVFSKFNMTGKLALPLFALFGVIMSSYLGGIYVIIILVAGISTFYALSKVAK